MTSPSPTRSVMMQSQLQHGRNNLYGSPLPQVKMSKESMDKSIDRLYRMKPPPKDPGPLTESKTLPKTQVDESVARLYEQAIQKRKTIAEGHEKKYLTREPAKKIPPDDMAESVQRVYAQAMKQKDSGRQALESKLRGGGGNYAELPKRRLDKEDMAATNGRLFEKPLQRKAEVRAKLETQFLDGSLRTFPKKTEVEWNATVERLYTGGK
eukprot:TRINITY_DN1558_c0_g3_i1.p2 TRINITY_DN1558_c0_g3~~TRINITY_DN1558_c0_g3_i1.p2  ORF type:complete len:210 (+),score=96.90 TRINITY_DN1558_c0_g3_i1:67-696(+)